MLTTIAVPSDQRQRTVAIDMARTGTVAQFPNCILHIPVFRMRFRPVRVGVATCAIRGVAWHTPVCVIQSLTVAIHACHAAAMVAGIICADVIIRYRLPSRGFVAIVTLPAGHRMVYRFVVTGVASATHAAMIKSHVAPIVGVMAVVASIAGPGMAPGLFVAIIAGRRSAIVIEINRRPGSGVMASLALIASEWMISGLTTSCRTVMAAHTVVGYVTMIEIGGIPGLGVMAFTTLRISTQMPYRFVVGMTTHTLSGGLIVIKLRTCPGVRVVACIARPGSG